MQQRLARGSQKTNHRMRLRRHECDTYTVVSSESRPGEEHPEARCMPERPRTRLASYSSHGEPRGSRSLETQMSEGVELCLRGSSVIQTPSRGEHFRC